MHNRGPALLAVQDDDVLFVRVDADGLGLRPPGGQPAPSQPGLFYWRVQERLMTGWKGIFRATEGVVFTTVVYTTATGRSVPFKFVVDDLRGGVVVPPAGVPVGDAQVCSHWIARWDAVEVCARLGERVCCLSPTKTFSETSEGSRRSLGRHERRSVPLKFGSLTATTDATTALLPVLHLQLDRLARPAFRVCLLCGRMRLSTKRARGAVLWPGPVPISVASSRPRQEQSHGRSVRASASCDFWGLVPAAGGCCT